MAVEEGHFVLPEKFFLVDVCLLDEGSFNNFSFSNPKEKERERERLVFFFVCGLTCFGQRNGLGRLRRISSKIILIWVCFFVSLLLSIFFQRNKNNSKNTF